MMIALCLMLAVAISIELFGWFQRRKPRKPPTPPEPRHSRDDQYGGWRAFDQETGSLGPPRIKPAPWIRRRSGWLR